MLINKSIPNLIGGISQQAPNIRLANQAERQENLNSSLVNGLQSRPRMKLFKGRILPNGLFTSVDRDEINAYNLIVNPTAMQVIEPDGTVKNVALSAAALAYLALEEGHAPEKYYKTLTLADHTFVLNKERSTAMTTKTSGAWVSQAMVFIKAVNYTTTWSLVISGKQQTVGYGGANTDGQYALYVNGALNTSNASLSSITVATKLAQIAISGFQISQTGSTLCIRRTDGAAFTIGLTDSRSDSCSALVTSRVQKFADLPTIAPDGYIVRVLGDTASTADDYYVKFVANTPGDFGKGVWEETVSPGLATEINAKTMPWVLENSEGTWSFHTFEWAQRRIGNEETNPTPQFIGSKIKNINLFRNRLCFLAEDLFCMSTAAEHGNWWNDTSFALTDSDPIYLSASTDGIKDLYDFGVMQETLVIFGETGQYSLQTPDVLSPKTAALLPLSSDAFTPDTGIVPAGSRLYFGHTNTDWYNCMEFGINNVTGLKEATSITAHVPSYIPRGTDMQLVGSSAVDALVVRSSGEPNSLFIYQYYISGGSKLQASWHKYNFKGAIIKGCFFRKQLLWLHIILNGVAYIATIDMTDRQIGADLEYCIDYMMRLATETSLAKTDWVLPAELRDSEVVAIHTLADGTVTLNPVINVDITTGALTLQYAATDIICGIPYKRLYEFSTQYITKGSEGKKVNITSGRWMLQRLILTCGISGKFDVIVKPNFDDAADSYLYKYTALTTGQQSALLGHIPRQEGVFKIPLRGKNTDIRTIISSDSWLPQSFVSAEWEGKYTTKIGRQI